MIQKPATYELSTGNPEATFEEFTPVSRSLDALPVPWIEPVDVSNALLWLPPARLATSPGCLCRSTSAPS
jgi:hypothetical protein